MTKEEFKLVEILKQRVWNVFHPDLPYNLNRISYKNLSIDICKKTDNNISINSVKRFFALTIKDEIKRKSTKGVIAMYAMEENTPSLSFYELEKKYDKFCSQVSIKKHSPLTTNVPDFITKIKGTYESYIITNKEKAIRKTIFLIDSKGNVKCKSSNHIEHRGTVEIKAFGRLIILNMSVISDGVNSFFQTLLQGSYDPGVIKLFGIFAGVSIHNVPMGGRELFVKIGDESLYETVTPCLYRIDKPEFNKLINEIPELVDFFAGKLDTFIETMEVVKKMETKKGE